MPAGVLRSASNALSERRAPGTPEAVVEMTGIAADVRSPSDYAVLGSRRTFHPLASNNDRNLRIRGGEWWDRTTAGD